MPTPVGSVTAEIILDTGKFKEELKKLKISVGDMKKSLKDNGVDTFETDLKKVQNALENSAKAIERLETANSDYKTQLKSLREQMEDYASLNKKLQERLKNTGSSSKSTAKEIKQLKETLEELSAIKIAPKGLVDFQNNWHKVTLQVKRDAQDIQGAMEKFAQTNFLPSNYIVDEHRLALQGISTTIKKLGESYNRLSSESRNAIRKMSSQAVKNEEYLENSFSKQQKAIKYITTGYNQLYNAMIKTSQVLGTFNFKLMDGIEKESIFYKRTLELASAMHRLNAQGSKNYAGRQAIGGYSNYISQSSQINTILEKQAKSVNATNNNLSKMGTGMKQVESRANGLYRGLQKVRSVAISLKVIAGAMGAMAVWNFAFDLVDKAKETYAAKNEMEALLNKNSRVSAGGIQVFNKALDDTVKRFQKINKYSMGETVASIGLEFNLNAKEMAESMDVISMIQSEYIRAGRTTEEAALAVKDILQGEFMRLSRETGVGKEELEKYGWDGDNKNVKSLMKALKKAATDRHWDLFAEKATSVNDIITITQSRFSEFGADLLTHAEPIIVGVFNGLIDGVKSVSDAFNGLNTFWQTFTVGSVAPMGLVGLSTLFLALKKNIGLVDVATMGWGKSVLTAAFNLNKADVATHGFMNSLAALITGTKAGQVANVGFTKSLTARVLGLQQNNVASLGLRKSMFAEQVAMRKGIDLTKVTLIGNEKLLGLDLNRAQKLAVLTRGIEVNEARELSRGRAILKTATSTRVLTTAAMGLMGIGIVTWLSSVAMWADIVKKRVENYNNLLATGKEDISEAQATLDDYSKKLSKMDKSDKNYALTRSNKQVAWMNVQDLKAAYSYAKKIQKADKEMTKSDDLVNKGILNTIYSANGVRNVEKYGQEYQKMKYVEYDIKKSEEERFKFQYASLQHIKEHVGFMKQAGATEEERVKYITEYSAKAEEAAENLKKFNQGDLTAGLYYVLNRVQLLWIDLWNNDHFVGFWKKVESTWTSVKPTVDAIIKWLSDLSNSLLDVGSAWLSTDIGKWSTSIAVTGGAIGLLVGKLSKWVTGNNIVLGGLKKLGSSLVQRIKDWRGVGNAAEEANTKSTGGVTTGGINTNVPKKGEFWKTVGEDAKSTGRTMFKYMGYIAAAIVLVTEAIVLINAPLGALAVTGYVFKQMEAEVKKGIDGLKLVAPTIIAILVPTIALAKVIDTMGGAVQLNLKSTLSKTAQVIATGMLLVAEAIFLLNAPLIAIASVGYIASVLGDNVKKGTEVMKVVADSLQYLVPFIPAFILGIGMVAVSMTGVGSVVYPVVIAGIATGLLLISGAIVGLALPLKAIEQLGSFKVNMGNIKKGAESLKITAESLSYVSSAMTSLAVIAWADLGRNIASIIANITGVDLTTNLTELTKKDGFLDKLNTFAVEFNKKEYTPVNQDKADALKTVADGMGVINDAMKSVKSAMDNLPDEFKNGSGTPAVIYDAETDKTSITGQVDVKGYFDTFKEPLKQLKEFVNEFNTSDDYDFGEGIDQSRVQAISQSADMFESLNNAVSKVKDVLGNVAMGNIMGNVASATGSNGGIPLIGGLGSIVGLIQGATSGGTGDYVSSMGGQFQEMENIIKDMTTFTNNISGLTGESSNVDVSGLASIVQQVSTQINNLKNTISNAVPQLRTNSKGLGGAIGDGLLEGFNTKMASVTPQLGNKIKTLGTTTLVPNFKQGIDKMSEAMGWELYYVGKAIDDKYDELGEKAYNLAKHMSDRFKDGDDMHSPGIISRTIQDEMGYIGQFLDGGLVDLPQKAFNLANALSSNFNFDLGLSNIQLPDLTQFTQGLSIIPSTVGNVKTQVSTNIQGMVTNVGNSLMNMKTNAVGAYNNIVTNTRTSLNNMQSQTTKNISGIKTSWRGMQTALINSAEAIRSKTQTKINKIKTNLGDFWNKVKHPDQLLQSAGGSHVGSIRRKFGSPRIPSMRFAGNGSLFKAKPKSRASPSDLLDEYFSCMSTTGSPCYAGWSYNWTPSIVKKFKGWKTHFNAYSLDNFLNVGKFENSNFPVKGNKDVAKAYIFDVIRATRYAKYFNSNFGDNPVAALLAGAFNCWDGTNIVLGLARAFGFNGYREHGTWNGVGHVWANIPGLGIIDPTAIQNRGTFKATGAVNYSGGSRKPLKTSDVATGGDTYNTNVEIHVHGNDVEVDNRRIDNRTGKQLLDILGINPATGR